MYYYISLLFIFMFFFRFLNIVIIAGIKFLPVSGDFSGGPVVKNPPCTAGDVSLIPGSIQSSCSVVSDSLQPHGLQHTRLSCPSPTHGACSNSCALSWMIPGGGTKIPCAVGQLLLCPEAADPVCSRVRNSSMCAVTKIPM